MSQALRTRDDAAYPLLDEEPIEDAGPRDASGQERQPVVCVTNTGRRQTCDAVPKMGAGLPKPTCRSRLQTAWW